MGHPGNDGDSAAFHRQRDQPAALFEVEVQELARGSQQGDPFHPARIMKVDQLQSGAQIDLVAAGAARSTRNYIHTPNCLHTFLLES